MTALDAALSEASGDPIRRALWLDEVDRRLRPCLPPSLAAHARFANLSAGRLVFLVDAPVWRARLRLASAELLDAARSIGLVATEVVVKTTTASHSPAQRATSTVIPMTTSQREALQAALASLEPPDPGTSSEDD